MNIVVNLRVRKSRDIVEASPGTLDLKLGEWCLARIGDVLEVGQVVMLEHMDDEASEARRKRVRNSSQLARIVRRLTRDDWRKWEDTDKLNSSAITQVKERVDAYDLDMKLSTVEYTFDRRRLYVYYTADCRVDFRELVRDLGYFLKTRIQMVQVGSRDEARITGDVGPCGRVLCCRTFLRNFPQISVGMAKQQELSISSKTQGMCGRLMCCLGYESTLYANKTNKKRASHPILFERMKVRRKGR
jgi:cell fate regulator YaaT (PSP1 superfamily)